MNVGMLLVGNYALVFILLTSPVGALLYSLHEVFLIDIGDADEDKMDRGLNVGTWRLLDGDRRGS